MKSLKLFLGAALAWLLVGTSGFAVAQDLNSCEGGSIENLTVQGDVRIDSSCTIYSSYIKGGKVIASFTDPTDRLIMDRTIVEGRVKVTGGSATITNNTVEGRLIIDSTIYSTVLKDNVLNSDGDPNIVARNNTAGVFILGNIVPRGDIKCTNNFIEPGTQPGELARGNVVPIGTVSCFGE